MTDKTKFQKPYQEHISLAEAAGRKPLTFPRWKKLARKNKKKQQIKTIERETE